MLQSLIMKQIAARVAKNRFGHLLDAVQSPPVRVTRKGRAIGVMMSGQHYEGLRGDDYGRRGRGGCRERPDGGRARSTSGG